MIADHVRALCFLVADGVVPANDKRGYVLRRILRRAIRHGLELGVREPFLHEIVPAVLDALGGVYPELLAASPAVLEVARREEERFAETIAAGIDLLEGSIVGLGEGEKTLPGAELFRLYDTFGLPLDLAQDIAEERGVVLDMGGFEREMVQQRARAQASWKGHRKEESAHLWGALAGMARTRFLGYESTRAEGVAVVAVRGADGSDGPLGEGAEGEVLLEATPFYAESGGQVGDSGWLVSPSGRARVQDTYRPAEGRVAHRVRVEAGRISAGDAVRAEVDEARRDAIRRNHTATHLLHAALREVVGTHVKQAGSLVAPDRLRFDFSHFAPLTDRATRGPRGPGQPEGPRRPSGRLRRHGARRRTSHRSDGAVRREVRRKGPRGARRRFLDGTLRWNALPPIRPDRARQTRPGARHRVRHPQDRGGHRLLATWLGHSDPSHTYWYVEAVPELLALAAHRTTTLTME